jgi:hypothetical protein
VDVVGRIRRYRFSAYRWVIWSPSTTTVRSSAGPSAKGARGTTLSAGKNSWSAAFRVETFAPLTLTSGVVKNEFGPKRLRLPPPSVSGRLRRQDASWPGSHEEPEVSAKAVELEAEATVVLPSKTGVPASSAAVAAEASLGLTFAVAPPTGSASAAAAAFCATSATSPPGPALFVLTRIFVVLYAYAVAPPPARPTFSASTRLCAV